MSNPFQYQSRAQDSWSQRATQSSSSYITIFKEGVKVYTPRKDANWLRFLPPTWPNAKHFGIDTYVHWIESPVKASFLCLAKNDSPYGKQKCPFCVEAERLNNIEEKAGYDIQAKKRVLVYFVDSIEENDPSVREGKEIPYVWAMPWTVDKDIVGICRDPFTKQLYEIDHPDMGYDVQFIRAEKGQGYPSYESYQLARTPSPVNPVFLQYISANPLPNVLLWRPAEELAQYVEVDVPQQAPVNPFAPPQQNNQQFAPVANAPYVAPVPPLPQAPPAPFAPVPQAFTPPPQMQQFSQPDPGTTGVFNPPPQMPVQPQQMSLPQQVPVEYCFVSVQANGITYGCSMPANHQGDHVFGRQIQPPTPAPEPVTFQPPQQQPSYQTQPPQYAPPPPPIQPSVAQTPASNALFQRYNQGR